MNKCLRLGLVGVWCASACWAVDWKALPSEGYLSDFAGVVDPASKAGLENYCAAVERSTGVRIALVTVASLQGEPVEDVADALARAWDVAQPNGKDGILLLLAIQERRYRLEFSSALEPLLPYPLSSGILGEMRPGLREQQFGQALFAAANALGSAIAHVKHVAPVSPLPRSTGPGAFHAFPWSLAIGGVFLVAWLMRAGGPRGYGWGGRGFLPWMVLGTMTGRSTWGGRGSGGFGGYDSGDGFGGFGGGDFGGGGASSDW